MVRTFTVTIQIYLYIYEHFVTIGIVNIISLVPFNKVQHYCNFLVDSIKLNHNG